MGYPITLSRETVGVCGLDCFFQLACRTRPRVRHKLGRQRASRQETSFVTYHQLSIVHLTTVLPAFLIGTYLLLNPKGTPRHKSLGAIYMLLMMITAGLTLFMPAKVGPTLLNHFGWLHLLSGLVIYSVPAALFAARNGNIRAHRLFMLGLYLGGIIVAGSFAFAPGRMLNIWITG